MTIGFTMALWLVMIVGLIFDAALNESVDSGGNSALRTANGDINTLVDSSAVSAKEVGVGEFQVSIPTVNVGFFNTTLKILTWDLQFFKGWMNVIRYVFLALTYATTIFMLRDLGPVMVAIASFIGQTLSAISGVASGAVRALLRF